MTPHFKTVYLPSLVFGAACTGSVLLHPELAWLSLTLVMWSLISGLGIAIGYHRLLSHQALSVSNILLYPVCILGCLGAQGSPLSWVAIHRGYHHPYSDRPRDLHSPTRGYWHAFAGWINTPAAANIRLVPAGRGMITSKFHQYLHFNYTRILASAILITILLDLLLGTGGNTTKYGLGIPIFLSLTQESCVNLICHIRKLGYRNYDTNDNSVNNLLVGYLCWGQGWHNNHHYDPAAFNFGKRWWEIDTSLIFLPLLKLFRKKA